jgi:hypothetical protein
VEKISQVRNQREAGSKLAISFTMVSYFAYSSTLKMEANVPAKRRFILHGVISQKIEFVLNFVSFKYMQSRRQYDAPERLAER